MTLKKSAPAATQEEVVNAKIKRSLIVTLILKLQNLRQEQVNQKLMDILLGA